MIPPIPFRRSARDETDDGNGNGGCDDCQGEEAWAPPEGFEERTRNRGVIAREFVEQRGILGHRAVGGFVSHCGWNSVLESLSAGVPILAWPMISEQTLNAKYVVEGLGAGVGLRMENNHEKMMIRDGVKELMGSGGDNARERAQALGRCSERWFFSPASQSPPQPTHAWMMMIDECGGGFGFWAGLILRWMGL